MSGLLDTSLVKLRRESRVSTILEAGFYKYLDQGKKLSFLTLTTSNQAAHRDLSRDYRELKRRLERRNLIPKNTQYCRIRTVEGNGVLHMIVTWPFVPRSIISELWSEIHTGSWSVDIREVKTTRKRLKRYLSPYLQGQSSRLSSSRAFIYQGWRKAYKKICRAHYWQTLPKLIIPPFCNMAYIRNLYYYYKQDYILNSLKPVLPT